MSDGAAVPNERGIDEETREERAREIYIRLAMEADERAEERLQSLKGCIPASFVPPAAVERDRER